MVQLRREAQPAIIRTRTRWHGWIRICRIRHPDPESSALFELMVSRPCLCIARKCHALSPGRRELRAQRRARQFRRRLRQAPRAFRLRHGFRVTDAAEAFRRALAKALSPFRRMSADGA